VRCALCAVRCALCAVRCALIILYLLHEGLNITRVNARCASSFLKIFYGAEEMQNEICWIGGKAGAIHERHIICAPMNVCYLDNSVVSSYFNENDALREITRELWCLMDMGCMHFVVSRVTADEALAGPACVRDFFTFNFFEDDILPLTVEARDLAADYIRADVLTENHEEDARHVAICTLAGIEILLSWNFTHLANLERRDDFNKINRLHGLPPVRILSPHEYLMGRQL